jgi:hypothetical protein
VDAVTVAVMDAMPVATVVAMLLQLLAAVPLTKPSELDIRPAVESGSERIKKDDSHPSLCRGWLFLLAEPTNQSNRSGTSSATGQSRRWPDRTNLPNLPIKGYVRDK